jgi:hypothetical protein
MGSKPPPSTLDIQFDDRDVGAQLCIIQPHSLSYIAPFVDTGAPVGFALPASPSAINKCALDKQVFF